MDKKQILTDALSQREEEILGYQINIDNYKLAIEMAKEDPDLADFAKNLHNLLASSILEQKKAKIMYEVIKKQVEEL
jgi:muramoyltetrapeptide carboxypeptidase LdcA involved in peptidoglycan recycling